MEESNTKLIFKRLIGIFFFLLFLAGLNFLSRYLTFQTIISFTNFMNRNSILIISIGLIFLLGELTSRMEFPSNVFSPILNFVGAWFLLHFVFLFLESFNRRFDLYFLDVVLLIKTPIYIGLLSLIFVFGYLPIIYKLLKKQKPFNSEKNKSDKIEVGEIRIVNKFKQPKNNLIKNKKSKKLKKNV